MTKGWEKPSCTFIQGKELQLSLKCGVVSLRMLENQLFSMPLLPGIEAQNFPFCTIEPNKGMVAVPDQD